MTLEEAIKIITKLAECQDEDWIEREYEALNLGIEALKRIQEMRKGISLSPYVDLPGETKE